MLPNVSDLLFPAISNETSPGNNASFQAKNTMNAR